MRWWDHSLWCSRLTWTSMVRVIFSVGILMTVSEIMGVSEERLTWWRKKDDTNGLCTWQCLRITSSLILVFIIFSLLVIVASRLERILTLSTALDQRETNRIETTLRPTRSGPWRPDFSIDFWQLWGSTLKGVIQKQPISLRLIRKRTTKEPIEVNKTSRKLSSKEREQEFKESECNVRCHNLSFERMWRRNSLVLIDLPSPVERVASWEQYVFCPCISCSGTILWWLEETVLSSQQVALSWEHQDEGCCCNTASVSVVAFHSRQF